MRAWFKSLSGGVASRGRGGKSERIALSEAMAGMILFSREQQSANFPNPGRLGCPPPEILRAPIVSGALPSDELRAHLLVCSECFRNYRTALAARRIQADALAAPRWRRPLKSLLSPGGHWRWAAAASLVLLILAGGRWVYRPQTPPGEQGRAAHPVAEAVPPAPAAAAAETARREVPPPAEEKPSAKGKSPAKEKRPAEEKLLQVEQPPGRGGRVDAGSDDASVPPPPPPDVWTAAPPPDTAAGTNPQPPPPAAPNPDPPPNLDLCKGCGAEPPGTTHSAPY